MTFIKNLSCWLSGCLILVASGCATAPQALSGICPPYPKPPPELLQPAPTLYLLPQELCGSHKLRKDHPGCCSDYAHA